jgi:hypothetical protein
MQAKYPPPAPSIQYYVETTCGHLYCWSAVDMESLFLALHDRNLKARTVMTWAEHEELQAEIELSKAYIERELKESA